MEQATVAMTIAFGKAAQDNRLDRVQWTVGDTFFTANLKSIDIEPIDTTQAVLTYELYRETELTSEFKVNARVELTVWYDNLATLNIQPISLLNKGLTDGSIHKYTEGYYGLKGGHILGLVGEEECIEQYLKGSANE